MNISKKQPLIAFFIFLTNMIIMSFPSSVFGWAAIDNAYLGTGFGTHQYLNKKAYEELEKHPAFPEIFPSLIEIQEYSGIDMDESGKGPDNPRNTKFSWHWYNPRTGKGEAPQTVQKYYGYFSGDLYDGKESKNEFTKKVSPPARNAAYLGHFIQDMTCGFHVVGMPGKDVNPDQPRGENVAGPYRTFTAEEWKDVVTKYQEYAKKNKEHFNWFDPNYYDGNYPYPAKGSTHVLYEGMVELKYKDEGGMFKTVNWFKQKSMNGFLSSDWVSNEHVDQFSKKIASQTRNRIDNKNKSVYFDSRKLQEEVADGLKDTAYSFLEVGRTLITQGVDASVESFYDTASGIMDKTYTLVKRHIKVPYDDWWRAVQATYTVWRASFSAILIQWDSDVKLVKEKDTPDTWVVQFRAANLEPESEARGVKAKFILEREGGVGGEHFVGDLKKYGENKKGWKSEYKQFTQSIKIKDPKKDKRSLFIRLSGKLSVPDAGKSSWGNYIDQIQLKAKRLPDLTGQIYDVKETLKGVNLELLRLGLPYKIKKILNTEDPDLEGFVKKQIPAPGWVHIEQEVELKVYDEFLVDVPKCVGKRTHIALGMITRRGLLAADPIIEEVESGDSKFEDGVVFEQKHEYKKRKDKVPLKTKITIYVAKVKKKEEVPPVVEITDEVQGTGFADPVVPVREEPKITSMKLTPRKARLKVGQSIEFSAIAYGQSGLPIPRFVLGDFNFFWSASDSYAVEIEKKGMKAIVTALKEGEIQITFSTSTIATWATLRIQGTIDKHDGLLDGDPDTKGTGGFGQKSKGITDEKYIRKQTEEESRREFTIQERETLELIRRKQEQYRAKERYEAKEEPANIWGDVMGEMQEILSGQDSAGVSPSGGGSGSVCPDGSIAVMGNCGSDYDTGGDLQGSAGSTKAPCPPGQHRPRDHCVDKVFRIKDNIGDIEVIETSPGVFETRIK